jgi:hypothetical protein
LYYRKSKGTVPFDFFQVFDEFLVKVAFKAAQFFGPVLLHSKRFSRIADLDVQKTVIIP